MQNHNFRKRMFGDNYANNAVPGRYTGQPTNFAEYEDEFREIDSEKSASRVKYLRKQYLLVFVQQFLAAWFIYEAYQPAATREVQKKAAINEWLYTHFAWAFVIPLILVSLLSLVAFFKRSLLSSSPVNWIAFTLFTVSFATLFAYLTVTHQTTISTGATTTTVVYGTLYYLYPIFLASMISLALTVHTFTTKAELTFQSASLYVVGSVLFVVFLYLLFSSLELVVSHILTVTGIIWGFYIVWEN